MRATPYFVGITRFFNNCTNCTSLYQAPLVQICAYNRWYTTLFLIVPIVPGFKKNKKNFFIFIQKSVYNWYMVKLYMNFLYFLIIFCTVIVWSLGTICVILFYFLKERMHIALKFFIKYFKLLKKAIFRTH